MADPENLFFWKGITLRQHSQVLKIGTDALLLGQWVPTVVPSAQSILDIGTGTGILALLMARSFIQAEVDAIDPDIQAHELASRNVNASDWNNRIRVLPLTLHQYSLLPVKHDLIISNPPFYFNHILPASPTLKNAKHLRDTVQEWMAMMTSLLMEDGSICLIVPSAQAHEWIRQGNASEVYCYSRLDVYSFPRDKKPKRSLLCFGRSLRQPELERMTLYREENIYTPEYEAWIRL